MSDLQDMAVSRRDFISLTAIGVAALTLPRRVTAKESSRMLYVGTYTDGTASKGIYRVRMSGSGALSMVGLAAATSNPSFVALSPDARLAFAVNEVEKLDGRPTGGITAFRRTDGSNALRASGQQATGGAAPCYVSTDSTGRFLFVANYTGGSVAVFPILGDGGIGPSSSFVQHAGKGPNAERQEGPHAHCIIPDPANKFVLVADLGLDRVLVYSFDAQSGVLTTTPAGAGVVKAGAGPRHLAFHPNGGVLYVTNELDSSVTAFHYDGGSGALTHLQTVSSVRGPIPKGNSPADIHVHPSGRVLYMSNRGENTIAAFTIDQQSFELTPLQWTPTGGDWPRNFAIDPSGRFMLVANQRSNDIHSFRIDRKTGRLTKTGHRLAIPAPVCIRFLPAPA